MDGDDTTTLTRDDGDEEGLGTRFWLKLAGGMVVIGILILIGLLIFWRALYAWGLFGTFMALAIVLIGVAWLYDRRHPHS